MHLHALAQVVAGAGEICIFYNDLDTPKMTLDVSARCGGVTQGRPLSLLG